MQRIIFQSSRADAITPWKGLPYPRAEPLEIVRWQGLTAAPLFVNDRAVAGVPRFLELSALVEAGA